MTIREATDADVPRVVEILKIVGNYVPGFDYSSMSHPLLVAEADGRIVGFLQGFIGFPYAYMADIAVLPEYRDRGVMSALQGAMDQLLSYCGVPAWVAFVREDNEECHRKIQSFGARPTVRGTIYQKELQ